MNRENPETFKSEPRELSRPSGKKIEPADTIYSKPFNKKEKESSLLVLKQIQQSEKREEVIKTRFMELATLFEKGRLNTPIKVAGEQHWMELNRFLEGGKEAKAADLAQKMADNKLNPARINIEFKLVNIEGRPDKPHIDFKISATRLLEGGGKLEQTLQRNITDIFGGTANHYKKIREADNSREKKEDRRPIDAIKKNAMEEGLRETGAIVTRINNGEVFTLIAEHPSSQRTVMVSLMGDKEPWRVEKISGKQDKQDIMEYFAGTPGELLAEIDRFIETG